VKRSILAVLSLAACGDDGGNGVAADAASIDMVAVEACTGGTDDDGDTFADCDDDDCWDNAACWQVADDADLPADLGDPSADIDKIRATLVGGTATFYATFHGAWPPPAATYWWYVRFEIANDGNTPVAGVTVERKDAVDGATYLGTTTASDVTVRQTPTGIWARIVNVPVEGEKYYIESGIQKATPGTRVTDTVVGAPAPLP